MAMNFYKKLKSILDNMSLEEKLMHKNLLKGPAEKPKGWLSIEDHLPVWKAIDFEKGFTRVKVKDSNGVIQYTQCTDHNMWYYMMKELGVTHWWND